MRPLFLSYRRTDTEGHARHLHHRLAEWFDEASELFFDQQSIESGDHFPQRLADALDAASVVLVLVGPTWLAQLKARAEQPVGVDFVRLELEHALQRQQGGQPTIIPVLLGGASLPTAADMAMLPAPLRQTVEALASRDAFVFGSGKTQDWDDRFARLLKRVASVPGAPQPRRRPRPGLQPHWRVTGQSLSPHFADPSGAVQQLRARLVGAGSDGADGSSEPGGPGGSAPAAVPRSAAAGASAARVAAVALTGMGGIGKTQLALAYSQAFRQTYAGVWWLHAETAGGQGDALLQQDALAACAAVDQPVRDGEVPSQVLKAWLAQQPAPWLLVFDNADNPAALRPHLPDQGPHHVVITARGQGWGGLATPLPLDAWAPAVGAAFLQRRLPGQADAAAALALAVALGGLPLALEQAASYVDSTGTTVADYLALWHSAAAELLDENTPSTGYERTVAATLSLAFGRLSPAAQQLLRLCAWAAPEPLPERVFTGAAALLPATLQPAAASPLAWNRVVLELLAVALVRREAVPSLSRPWQAGGVAPEGTPTENALTMHRLTQQVVRGRLSAGGGDAPVLLQLLGRASPADAQTPSTWPTLSALQPHALQLNEPGLSAVFAEPQLVRQRTWLLNGTAGFLQFGLGLRQEARVLYERILSSRQQALGDGARDTIIALVNLIELLRLQGDVAAAAALVTRGLEASRRVLGEDDPETLMLMERQASLWAAQGELARAEALEDTLLSARRRLLGPHHLHTLNAMSNLAHTLRQQGGLMRLTRAWRLEEAVLSARVQHQGPDHPHTLIARNNLAATLAELGDYDATQSLQRDVLQHDERVLGHEHPDTLTARGNLAHTLSLAGQHPAAFALADAVVDARTRRFGADNIETLQALHNRAIIRWRMGEHDAARRDELQALRGFAAALGVEHPLTRSAAGAMQVMMDDIRSASPAA